MMGHRERTSEESAGFAILPLAVAEEEGIGSRISMP